MYSVNFIKWSVCPSLCFTSGKLRCVRYLEVKREKKSYFKSQWRQAVSLIYSKVSSKAVPRKEYNTGFICLARGKHLKCHHLWYLWWHNPYLLSCYNDLICLVQWRQNLHLSQLQGQRQSLQEIIKGLNILQSVVKMFCSILKKGLFCSWISEWFFLIAVNVP